MLHRVFAITASNIATITTTAAAAAATTNPAVTVAAAAASLTAAFSSASVLSYAHKGNHTQPQQKISRQNIATLNPPR